ncbi:MAG TPA: protein phosphatase 2C domain-containing protein [Vicinamibacterales bacterium]|jgi:protein phosphatase|nr:protein phosphatase 2C domain-containing protein [Vicinamibacterales bacterium]
MNSSKDAMANEDARRKALAQLIAPDEFEPLSATVKVEFGARSDRGRVRPQNDDHYLVIRLSRTLDTILTSLPDADLPPRFEEFGYGMAVADGLGTGGAGSVAGRLALSTIAHLMVQYGKWNLRVDPKNAPEILARAQWIYDRIDQAIVGRGYDVPQLFDMAAALTGAISAGDHLFIGHVGHSRAYLFRDGTLTLLTRDHTTEQHLAETGKPIAMERRGKDRSHILTDAIGARGDRPATEVEHYRLINGDCLLLCTNGLTDMVEEDQIADVLALRRHPQEQCQILVDLANQRGGEDNVTVILAEYDIPKT